MLTTVALAVIAYLIKEIVGDRVGDLKNARSILANSASRYVVSEAKPVNEHLVGSIGKVIAHSGDSGRPMRVRVGLELWPARLQSGEDEALPVDTPVEVVAVDGPVLVVGASSAPH